MILLTLLLACGTSAPPSLPPPDAPQAASMLEPMPADSLYALGTALVDQHGREISLDVHRGHPVVISMFYASCPTACPMLIGDVKALEDSLDAAQRADLRVLLVSLDPARDTPERFAEVVEEHALDDTRWTLARVAPNDVRAVAAALGIRYRLAGDGEMNHSSILTLLDVQGRPLTRIEGLRRDAAPLREALARARPLGGG